MPKHDITVIQPARTTLHSDYTVEIKSDNAILGKLSISKGGVDWLPKNAKKPWSYSWEQFAALLTGYGNDPAGLKAAIKASKK
jgi:hypothetical protein